MAQDIRQFYQSAKDRDFSRDFHMRVSLLTLPELDVQLTPADLVYCKAASLPGRSITNVEVPYMGLNFNVPGTAIYDSSDAYELTFYMDDPGRRSGGLRAIFENATRNIFDDRTSTGLYRVPAQNSKIKLDVLDQGLGVTPLSFELVGASIRKIDPIEYKIAEGKGEVQEMKVTFAYHYYVVPGIGINDVGLASA